MSETTPKTPDGATTCDVEVTSQFMPALAQRLGQCGIKWEIIGEDECWQTHTIRVGVIEGHQTEWMADKAGAIGLGGGRALGRETRLTFKPPVIEFEEREAQEGSSHE